MDFGFGPIPEWLVYMAVIGGAVFYAFGRKKKVHRLENESRRLSAEIDVERKKSELAKFKAQNKPKSEF